MMGGLMACWCLDLFLAVLVVGLTWYLWLKRRYGFFARRGIPYIIPESIMASNLFGAFLPKDTSTGEVYDDMYKKLKPQAGQRGYGGYFHLLSPSYLITSPEMVTKMTVSDFVHFNDHGLPLDEELNPLEGNLFFASGPKWRALRKKLSPTFTSGKLKWMFSLIEECGHHLVENLEADADTGKEVEMRDLLARFTTDVIGSCAFGIDSKSLKDADSQFRRMGRKFFDPPLSLKLKTIARFTVPRFYKWLGLKSGQPEVEEFFMNTISQAFEHRLRTGTKRNDLVQLLLQLRETGSIEYEQDDPLTLEEDLEIPEEGEPVKLEMTDAVLTAQAFAFFVAGFETTASSISYSLYLMAKHQDVQEKARREVREVMAKHGGKINYDALKDMVYLDACLRESIRLYPPVQLLARTCTKDYTTGDGHVIEKGRRVIMPIFSFHRDPEYFDDPLEFRPERFMPDAPPPVPGSYIPFGYGPRLCIGQRFAILESKLCLATMVNRFKFTLGPNMIDPIILVAQTFIAVPKGGIKLLIRRVSDDEK